MCNPEWEADRIDAQEARQSPYAQPIPAYQVGDTVVHRFRDGEQYTVMGVWLLYSEFKYRLAGDTYWHKEDMLFTQGE